MNATDTIDAPPELTILQPAAVSDKPERRSPSPQPEAAPPEGLAQSCATDEAQPPHRKIAKLPKPLRDLINTLLDDGLPARQIIAKLGACIDPPLPYPISEKNISDWRSTGYRRHLAEQERLALVQANREGGADLTTGDDVLTLPEATLQIIANQYYEFLADFSPETLKEKLSEDPLKYTRFLNVFARLVREIVYLRKFRVASAKATAAKLKQLDPDRDLADNEFDAILNQWDRAFKVARPRKPAAPTLPAERNAADPLPAHPSGPGDPPNSNGSERHS